MKRRTKERSRVGGRFGGEEKDVTIPKVSSVKDVIGSESLRLSLLTKL